MSGEIHSVGIHNNLTKANWGGGRKSHIAKHKARSLKN